MNPIEVFTSISRGGFHAARSRRRIALSLLFIGWFAIGMHVRVMAQSHATWSDYGGGPDSAQYSALDEINRTNVSKLQVAWVFPTGDDNRYFFNPIEAHGLAYVMAQNNSIVALDAGTGKVVWVHPADAHTEIITNRGINYWESKDGSDRRLLFAANHSLQAIDARTGNQILTFGTNGRFVKCSSPLAKRSPAAFTVPSDTLSSGT